MYSVFARSAGLLSGTKVRWIPLAGISFVLGCGAGRLQPILPVGMAPSSPSDAVAWTETLQPTAYRYHRFRWSFQDDRGAAGGRGSLRIAAPDSLRFDVSAGFGSKRAAAMVIGDSAEWAEPEDEVDKLVPNYPLLWAMVAVPRRPPVGAQVRHLAGERIDAWQFAWGQDTVEYVLRSGEVRELIADVRQGTERIGRVTTTFGADGSLIRSQLIVPSRPAKLEITYLLSRSEQGFEPDVWIRPEP